MEHLQLSKVIRRNCPPTRLADYEFLIQRVDRFLSKLQIFNLLSNLCTPELFVPISENLSRYSMQTLHTFKNSFDDQKKKKFVTGVTLERVNSFDENIRGTYIIKYFAY